MSTDAQGAGPARRPRLAVLLGDPNGIGPEIAIKLLARAETIGPEFQQLLVQVLKPHAKLNYRRGLALLRFKEKFPREQLNQAAAYATAHHIHTPKQFHALLHPAQSPQQELPLAISAETQALVRTPDYFIH